MMIMIFFFFVTLLLPLLVITPEALDIDAMKTKNHQFQIIKDDESSRLCRVTDVNYFVSRS